MSATCLLAQLSAACSDDASPQSSLITHRAWAPSDDAADPFFALEQPTTSVCDSFGHGIEDLDGEQTYFVQTQACPYLTVEQAAGRDVEAGQSLYVRLHHWALTSDRPARGHAAIATRSGVLWEYHTDIPKAETDVAQLVVLDAPLSEGEPIYFHVHNHGDNEWALVNLRVED